MGFMGKPKWLETPNMDKMAKEGAHIQNAFVTTALCSPSRASVLTGMFLINIKLLIMIHLFLLIIFSFLNILQKRGYETAFIGKWHMGSESDEPRKGFDKWISFKGQGVYSNPA
jgi:N-acetylglucosamine-6-sulfatase